MVMAAVFLQCVRVDNGNGCCVSTSVLEWIMVMAAVFLPVC